MLSVITRAEVLAAFVAPQMALAHKSLDHFPALPITTESLRRSERRKLPDALQAAVAIHHGLVLVTPHSRDFRSGSELEACSLPGLSAGWVGLRLSPVPEAFPRSPGLDRGEVETCALVVGRVEPEHLLEDSGRCGSLVEAPRAQAGAIQASEEGVVVRAAPRKDALELRAERQRADCHARLVVAHRLLRVAVELDPAEVRVSVEAAEIPGQELHEDLGRAASIPRLVQVGSRNDRIRLEIVWIGARNHLLHLEHGSLATSDDGLRPVLDRLAILGPVLVRGIPLTSLAERQWLEPEGDDVASDRGDLPRGTGAAHASTVWLASP